MGAQCSPVAVLRGERGKGREFHPGNIEVVQEPCLWTGFSDLK